jgi:DNA-binding NtrC family response regulator
MKQRILAVDDEPHMLKLLERIISEKTPYAISTTNNSLEVPRLLDEQAFDLIIADLKMPGMGGMDILRMIKEKGRPEEVILITAFGSLETAIESLSLGVFEYITKPFKKERIIFTVDRAMQWQRLKKESIRIAKVFEREPFEEACLVFEKEYIRRLSERHGGNRKVMAQRSGLSEEKIALAIEQNTHPGG